MTIRIHKANQPIIKNDTDELYISSSRWKEICNHLNKNCYDLTVTIQDFDDNTNVLFELNRIKTADYVIIDVSEFNVLDLGFIIGLSTYHKQNVFVCLESLTESDRESIKQTLSFHDIAFYDDLDELLSIWFTQDY